MRPLKKNQNIGILLCKDSKRMVYFPKHRNSEKEENFGLGKSE